MRIVAVADTHNRHHKLEVPDGDIFIHAGDFSGMGTQQEFEKFAGWYHTLTHPYKLVVPGNHDCYCTKQWSYCCTRLDNRLVESGLIEGPDGLRILCYAWTVEVYANNRWEYNAPRQSEQFKRFWSLAPPCDILVTHGPPYGVLDLISDPRPCEDPHVGEYWCRSYIYKHKPRIHIFGHIHEGYGQTQLDQTQCYNVSACDAQYKLSHPVTVIDL